MLINTTLSDDRYAASVVSSLLQENYEHRAQQPDHVTALYNRDHSKLTVIFAYTEPPSDVQVGDLVYAPLVQSSDVYAVTLGDLLVEGESCMIVYNDCRLLGYWDVVNVERLI